MADALDAPTVYRDGPPTLGVPVFSLAYRPGMGDPLDEAPIIVLTRWVVRLENRVNFLEQDLAWMRRPWPVRAVLVTAAWIRLQWARTRRWVQTRKDR